jgi:hypothetical protein
MPALPVIDGIDVDVQAAMDVLLGEVIRNSQSADGNFFDDALPLGDCMDLNMDDDLASIHLLQKRRRFRLKFNRQSTVSRTLMNPPSTTDTIQREASHTWQMSLWLMMQMPTSRSRLLWQLNFLRCHHQHQHS